MVFLVNYQQFKYTDRSDNPRLRTWRIEASDAENAFVIAQDRAVQLTKVGNKVGGVRRTMQDELGDLVTAQGDYTTEYMAEVVR